MSKKELNLRDKFKKEIAPALMKELQYENFMLVPKMSKVTINMGLGEAALNQKIVDSAVKDLTIISGQKPVVTKAKKAIAGFKLREGQSIGCKVTLRESKMYEFMERLINITLPRVRDFSGLKLKSFDGRGNYTFGIKEQIVFNEIEYDKIDKIRGMDITITTTAKTDEEAKALLLSLGMPFEKEENK